MKLTVSKSGVWLDDHFVKECTQVDIKNINRMGDFEVVLHIVAHEADIHWNDDD